jgi:hypothetical protein
MKVRIRESKEKSEDKKSRKSHDYLLCNLKLYIMDHFSTFKKGSLIFPRNKNPNKYNKYTFYLVN